MIKSCKDCIHYSNFHYMLPEWCSRKGYDVHLEDEREPIWFLSLGKCGPKGKFFSPKDED